ncbi:MAG: 1-phosphofructokinase [bacterium]|nr:1-phosphofructokinase [bacterium]
MSKIITVTLNPAVDKTVWVEELHIGGLNRVREAREDAGGKGINVSRAVCAFGGETLALGFLGGRQGAWIREILDGDGVAHCFTPIGGETRTNVKVVGGDGSVTELNEAGPAVTERELAALFDGAEAQISKGDLLVLSGSAPKGVPKTVYAELTALGHRRGARVLLDADGELFAEGIAAKPDIIKPNTAELSAYCRGQGILMEGADEKMRALSAARTLKERGVAEILVSMGAQGAVLVTEKEAWYAPAVPVTVCSTVGAGDTMAAAYALSSVRGLSAEERLKSAAAAAAGAVAMQGTRPPSLEQTADFLTRVHVEPLLSK